MTHKDEPFSRIFFSANGSLQNSYKRRLGGRALLFLFLLCLPLLSSQAYDRVSFEASRPIYVLSLNDTIQPVSADYLKRGLEKASKQGAEAVIVELNTPGGLLTSTREMVGSILSSSVPVVLYVSPAGARAGSAGFYLLEAADLAAMAPGTNAGAAHPVVEGAKLDEDKRLKLENDAAAFLRSYLERRKRNIAAAEEAVRASKSYSAAEAQQLGLIDGIAKDRDELRNSLDGRQITRFDGRTVTLHTKNSVFIPFEMSLRERVLDFLVRPDLALLFLVAGALLIYLEFNTPGTIIPGSLGTLFVVLSLFALNLLPLRSTAIFLLLAGVALVLLEAHFTSHGVLGVTGILAMAIGAVTLVDAPIPELRVHKGMGVALALAFGAITLLLIRLAVRASRNKTRIGIEALVGETGKVVAALTPQGQVLVHGELWKAESEQDLVPGEAIRVKGHREFCLLVERVPDEATSLR